MMRAVYLNGHGGNEVVQIGQRPRPVRQAGEVLLRMKAATLNQVDLYMRNSGAGITHSLPQIMGLDGAGVVDEVGPEEMHWQVGDAVLVHPGVSCGRCAFCLRGEGVLCPSIAYLGEHRDGTLAEWVSVKASNVFAKPAHLTFEQAAVLGVTHLTAWRMLFTKAQLKPWETVLIFGIGGGVSLAAMQLAKLTGAKVIVTSREDSKLAHAQQLGADGTINSSTDDVVKSVLSQTHGRGVDVVIENVGQAVWSAAMKSLVRGGRLVTCGATTGDQPGADLRRIFIRQLQIFGSTLGDLHEMTDLLAFCERTQLVPVIDRSYPMQETHAALDRLSSAQQFGKLVIQLD